MKLLNQLFRSYWLVLTVVLLVACTDNDTNKATDNATDKATNNATDNASQTPDVTNTDTADSTTATSTEPSRRPLDLNLDLSDIQTNPPDDDIGSSLEKQSQLPDFFAETKSIKQKKKVAVGAKILTDPAVEKNYIESAKGAEIKVEIQTGKQKPK